MTTQELLGSLRAENGKGVVHVEDVYAAGIDDLWACITEPARLRRWVGDVTGDLREGGAFRAAFTSSWTGQGRVEVCDAPHRLVVTTWDDDDEEDDRTVIEALLTAEGDKTRLVIEDRGLPLSKYAYHGSGWQTHIEDLAAIVEGREPSDWETRWKELTPAWLALLED